MIDNSTTYSDVEVKQKYRSATCCMQSWFGNCLAVHHKAKALLVELCCGCGVTMALYYIVQTVVGCVVTECCACQAGSWHVLKWLAEPAAVPLTRLLQTCR